MGRKAGLLAQILFAVGVLVMLLAIVGSFTGEFRALHALGIGLLGLAFTVGASRRMRL